MSIRFVSWVLRTLGAAVAFLGALAGPVLAGQTDLSNAPLTQNTAASVPPNIMFILDDSGSMARNYMPDYVTDDLCRNSSGELTGCAEGRAPFYAYALNGVYYNPSIQYLPPKNADGSSLTNFTSWTDVPVDGFVANSATTNLVGGYPETVFCKNSNDSTSTMTNCVYPLGKNADSTPVEVGLYAYPNNTYDHSKTRNGPPVYYITTVEFCKNSNGGNGTFKNFGKAGTCQSKYSSTYDRPRYSLDGVEGRFKRVEIVPSVNSYTSPNGITRTYAQEMTNFANWYAYYRTRMQSMKSSASHAFSGLDDSVRVGYSTINDKNATDNDTFLTIGAFNTTQKTNWYSRLLAASPPTLFTTTPLRGALSKAGRIYAGKIGTDPITASCQQNFTILSTDGYWNANAESSTYGPKDMDNSANVGDQDGTAVLPSKDALKKSNTLADVAYYYYHTDLRPDVVNDVPKVGTNAAVDDVATHQHMTTFTVGLGVDGNLSYVEDYKTNTNSAVNDYYNILQGTKSWPDPIDGPSLGDEDRIDDLWHAAVNGRGTYFSAKDPASLVSGLKKSLATIGISVGSGAAAATSNLEPVAGDNFVYLASYRTMKWDGNLSGHTINISSGTISDTPNWQASTTLSSRITDSGGDDTRKIYTWDATADNKLKEFRWGNLTETEQGYFSDNIGNLTQYSTTWSDADKTAATGASLVNYLRGHDRNEDQARDDSFTAHNRLYRDRDTVLGDLVHSQPIYVKSPWFSYDEEKNEGHQAFKVTSANRTPAVLVAANDGMLHSFNANNGSELWAYVPPVVMPEMWRLADNSYGENHRYYVDGVPVAGDVFDGTNWRTIVVGGFNKGGRGYYAMDITVPGAPKALWNFTVSDDSDLGLTYGRPIIAKLGANADAATNGTWVVLVTSGYNNVSPGDGQGYLYVLNAVTGVVISKIATGEGDTTTPSGLAQINAWVDSFTDNAVTDVYGGDLLGNLWKFNVVTGSATKIAAFGADEPITVRPELGKISGNRMLFFGTGRYLGTDDLSDQDTQYIYGIKESVGTVDNPRSNMVAQTLTNIDSSTRTTSSNVVNLAAKDGWYIALPDTGERVNINPILEAGALIVASNVPTATECSPGGYSWLYMLNFRTGAAIPGVTAGHRFNNITVGLAVVRLADGVRKVLRTGHNNPMPSTEEGAAAGASGPASFSVRRHGWRELLED